MKILTWTISRHHWGGGKGSATLRREVVSSLWHKKNRHQGFVMGDEVRLRDSPSSWGGGGGWIDGWVSQAEAQKFLYQPRLKFRPNKTKLLSKHFGGLRKFCFKRVERAQANI
jgi:hypothetical protein